MRSTAALLGVVLGAGACTSGGDVNGVPRCRETPRFPELRSLRDVIDVPSNRSVDMVFEHGQWMAPADLQPTKSHNSGRVVLANLAEFPALEGRSEVTRFSLEFLQVDAAPDPASHGRKATYQARIVEVCAP